MSRKCVIATTVALLLVTHSLGLTDAKRTYGNSNRKTSSGGGYSTRRQPSNTGHTPSYPTQSGSSGNSHADVAKLSYPNYNSQPNRPATGGQNPAQIGWNVPNKQGPPPAYSASNPVGGAKTNVHDAPPAYRPNNAPPPSYSSAGSNAHTPITATNTHGVQSSYPGATYHSPGSLPAGATYYPSGGHVPAGGSYYSAGGIPAGATYYPSGGHMPAGGGYYPSGGVPAGASYFPAGASLPAGATYYSSPPRSSSGLGFGSGLAAGALGGALLGHALTPTQTRVIEQAPAGGGSGGDGKVIIINNGPPGSVTTSDAAGTTVINNGAAAQPNAPAAAGAAIPPVVQSGAPIANSDEPNVPLAPMVPVDASKDAQVNGTSPAASEQPPPGGIVCVPVRVNDTDPTDNTKTIEVEKIACYPAPPPEVNAAAQPPAGALPAAEGSAPLAPMNAGLQQHATAATLLPEQSTVQRSGSGAGALQAFTGVLTVLMALLLASDMY